MILKDSSCATMLLVFWPLETSDKQVCFQHLIIVLLIVDRESCWLAFYYFCLTIHKFGPPAAVKINGMGEHSEIPTPTTGSLNPSLGINVAQYRYSNTKSFLHVFEWILKNLKLDTRVYLGMPN